MPVPRPPATADRFDQASDGPGPRGRRGAADGRRGGGEGGRGGRSLPPLPGGWLGVLVIVGLVALLAVCGYGGYLLFADDKPDSSALASTAGPTRRDISTQVRDPQPLAVAEVFPAAAIRPDPSQPAYTLVKGQLSADCATAATAGLGAMLKTDGCTQVVRGTLLSPTKAYVLTAGIFNMEDERGALAAHDAIQPLLDAKKDRFAGYAAGGTTDVIARSATQLGWDYRGHYLVYCVVARADGKPLDARDPQAGKIIDDMVQLYLTGTVVEHRVVPTTAAATPSGSAH